MIYANLEDLRQKRLVLNELTLPFIRWMWQDNVSGLLKCMQPELRTCMKIVVGILNTLEKIQFNDLKFVKFPIREIPMS